MLRVCSRGGASGRVGSRAGGGSDGSGGAARVRVAVEEQVSSPFISFKSENKAVKDSNETDVMASGVTVLCRYCDVLLLSFNKGAISYDTDKQFTR